MTEISPELLTKFFSKIKKSNNCWIWVGVKNGSSYGTFKLNKKNIYAHRFSYELFNGNITTGLTIDHLCRNPSCVNPDHLETVTQRENNNRGNTVSGINYRKIVCKKGHDNFVKRKDGKGRRCKTCDSLYSKTQKLKIRVNKQNVT